jgi:hypothetical protein
MNNEDGEVAQVTHFMKGVARAMELKPVPDAQAMWFRIQLAERQRLADLAQRPMRFAWMFAKCWFAGGAGLIFYREWPVIGNFFLTMPTYVSMAIAAAAVMFVIGRRSLKGLGVRSRGMTV